MLRRITHDYLAIQGSAMPSEHAFSSGGITASLHQSSLSTDNFEALQILKSTYRNGHATVADQAGKHVNA
jgi:hypothetical protein